MQQPSDPTQPQRGPPEDTPAIARAREYGIDITLLEAMLDRTVEERLRMLDENLQFVQALRPSPTPAVLPSLEQLARRVVEATRDPARLAGLSPAEISTVRQAHAVLRRPHRSH